MSRSKIPDVLFDLGQELELDLDFNTCLPNGDSVLLGFQMYEALIYCPGHQDEARRLSLFFESLLADQSLGTVLAATFNNLELRRGNAIMDYTAMNIWYNQLYRELDAMYNFSLGPSVMALSTVEQLHELTKLDPPYMGEYKGHIYAANGMNATYEDVSGDQIISTWLISMVTCFQHQVKSLIS